MRSTMSIIDQAAAFSLPIFKVIRGVLGKEIDMLATIVIAILVLALFGALPKWNYSRSWGYMPSGGLGLVLGIVLILVYMAQMYQMWLYQN
jgi:Protein of unknown function (DUF3309)